MFLNKIEPLFIGTSVTGLGISHPGACVLQSLRTGVAGVGEDKFKLPFRFKKFFSPTQNGFPVFRF